MRERRDQHDRRVHPARRHRIASEDLDRFLEPGDEEDGWVVRQGRMPLGYFKDPEATERTFRTVNGVRVVQSGDRGRISEDGTLLLRGRDSLVINTGGEKVFAEEVEEVLRTSPTSTTSSSSVGPAIGGVRRWWLWPQATTAGRLH